MRAHRFARRVVACVVVVGGALGLLGSGGCVNQAEMDRLAETNRSLTESNQRMKQDLDESRLAMDRQRQALAKAEAAIEEYKRQYGDARGQLDAALKSLRDFEGRLAGVSFVALDPETDRALTELAQKYPDLIQYDAARGMLRFSADLTFDSGSAVVRDSAQASLSALANILKTSAASAYEILVVGHTDSQRISSGTARLHPTNMHLSCHRAIAVRDVLNGQGVPPDRVQAAGWGEFRPAVTNTPSGNTPQNRRVEIFLTRSTAAATAETATTPRATVPARQPDEIVK